MKTLFRFSFRFTLLIAIFLAAFECQQLKAQCTFTNGTFEDGTLNGWTVYNQPTVKSFIISGEYRDRFR
jgi:hypothetical protein